MSDSHKIGLELQRRAQTLRGHPPQSAAHARVWGTIYFTQGRA